MVKYKSHDLGRAEGPESLDSGLCPDSKALRSLSDDSESSVSISGALPSFLELSDCFYIFQVNVAAVRALGASF